MDVYGMSAPECFPVADLLDFSKDEIFYASNDQSTPSSDHNNYAWAPNHFIAHNPINQSVAFFTEPLCVPTLHSDDVAELEWLSNFVEDSFTDFPANDLSGTLNIRPETSFQSRSRSKRSRAASTNSQWISSPESDTGKTKANNIGRKREISSSSFTGDRSPPSRRCTHCSSEKTPQWRTGPLGPKTLCNACGVRFKSGRLVPEYRPAASPTFVLTQHSNSHRKVMELRRQKEIVRRQNRHNFEFY